MENHVYLTREQILFKAENKCDVCLKKFANGGAFCLHRIKVHKIVDKNSSQEMRLHDRVNGSKIKQIFHCPEESCKEEKRYSSFSKLYQHYMRSHVEKNLKCDGCSYKTGYMKDFVHHAKNRCPTRKGKGASARLKQNKHESNSSKKLGASFPIILVAAADDVQQVVNNIQYSLSTNESGSRPIVKVVDATTALGDILNVDQLPFPHSNLNMNGNGNVQMMPSSSYCHDGNFGQGDNGSSCERGTGMGNVMDYGMPYFTATQYENEYVNTNHANDKRESHQAATQTQNYGITFDSTLNYDFGGNGQDPSQSHTETRSFGTTMAPQEFHFVEQNLQHLPPPQMKNCGTTMSFDATDFGFLDDKVPSSSTANQTRSFGTTMTNDLSQQFASFEQEASVDRMSEHTKNSGTTTDFDSVSIRHCGTSMCDNTDSLELYYRDTQTQTPIPSMIGPEDEGKWPW